MNNQSKVRIGVIGIGNMGSIHAARIAAGEVPGAELAAICDMDESRFNTFPDTAHFTDHKKMLLSGEIDAVIIASPHFFHTPLAIDAMDAGIHLLVDKPLGVHKADCQKTIDAYNKNMNKNLVFAVMFNMRTRPIYRRLKTLIDSGELGKIYRINWTITDWFRSEIYYKSGGWRATWKGEGGGVLLNQCPHQLDLLQWMFGLPDRVRAYGSMGKYHDIEVEDDVTAYMEFPGGTTGVFIASTGESPGTNRLEIAADHGRVIAENDKITWIRNEVPASVFSAETKKSFGTPPVWNVDVPVANQVIPEHVEVMTAFAAAIQDKGDLIAHGSEGIRSVELGNAMLYSILNDETVQMPLDAAAYEEMLTNLIAKSRFRKKTIEPGMVAENNIEDSF